MNEPLPPFKTYAELCKALGIPDPSLREEEITQTLKEGSLTPNQLRELRMRPPREKQ